MFLDRIYSAPRLAAQSLKRVLVGQSRQKRLKVLTEVAFYRQIFKFDVFGNFIHIFGVKRRCSGSKLEKQDSQWPPVDVRVVTLFIEDLWWHVLRRATQRVSLLHLRVLTFIKRNTSFRIAHTFDLLHYFFKLLWQAKVRQLNVPCLAQQDILWFEVPIDNFVLMQVLQRQDDLTCEELYFMLLEPCLPF